MEIYIIQSGDTIDSIAERFGVPVEKLIYDNDINNPEQLVQGQAIVIAYPKQTHKVQQGDSLESIANTYSVSVMQLLRNNSFLLDRGYLIPGETLVISYNTKRSITTNGYAFPFINQDILIKSLPNLTYLSIFNYRILEDLSISSYYDDSGKIQLSKEYKAIPLLLISILTSQGEPDVDTAYKILLSEENQIQIIDKLITIIGSRGYMGVNLVVNLLNGENQSLYHDFVQRISNRLKQVSLLFFLTINYRDEQIHENIDYAQLSMHTDNMIFMQLKWGKYEGAPMPVSNISVIKSYTDVIISQVPPEVISLGKTVIGYDWQLPYVPQTSSIAALSLSNALSLAYDTNSVIHFDEESQTPYFTYRQEGLGFPSTHIVWFVDARSINALINLIQDKGIQGNGIWNIMTYYAQLWLLINSQFDIIKII